MEEEEEEENENEKQTSQPQLACIASSSESTRKNNSFQDSKRNKWMRSHHKRAGHSAGSNNWWWNILDRFQPVWHCRLSRCSQSNCCDQSRLEPCRRLLMYSPRTPKSHLEKSRCGSSVIKRQLVQTLDVQTSERHLFEIRFKDSTKRVTLLVESSSKSVVISRPPPRVVISSSPHLPNSDSQTLWDSSALGLLDNCRQGVSVQLNKSMNKIWIWLSWWCSCTRFQSDDTMIDFYLFCKLTHE